MTTVEFGGGASLELRRKFCSPKDGTQIPGFAFFPIASAAFCLNWGSVIKPVGLGVQ